MRSTVYVSTVNDKTSDRIHLCSQPCMKEFLADMGISRRTRGRMTGFGWDGAAYEVTVRRRVENSDFCDLCGTERAGVTQPTLDPISPVSVIEQAKHAGSSGPTLRTP